MNNFLFEKSIFTKEKLKYIYILIYIFSIYFFLRVNKRLIFPLGKL